MQAKVNKFVQIVITVRFCVDSKVVACLHEAAVSYVFEVDFFNVIVNF